MSSDCGGSGQLVGQSVRRRTVGVGYVRGHGKQGWNGIWRRRIITKKGDILMSD